MVENSQSSIVSARLHRVPLLRFTETSKNTVLATYLDSSRIFNHSK